MNVSTDDKTGKLRVEPPLSEAEDHITFQPQMNLTMALRAYLGLQGNGRIFKPVHFNNP